MCYERLYAYLQDDVTQRRPSVDLMLNLLCSSFEAKLDHRQRFIHSAPLLQHHLVQLFDDPSRQPSPLLGKFIKLDERIASYLLNADDIDARLLPYAAVVMPQGHVEDLVLPDDVKRRLMLLLRAPGDAERPVFYFQGPYGVGKQTAAEALCCERQVGLLVVAGGNLLDTELSTFELVVQLAKREAMLQGAALYWEGFDGLLAEDKSARRAILLREIEALPGPKFLAGDVAWEPMDALRDSRFVRIEFARPTHVRTRAVVAEIPRRQHGAR